MMMKRFVFLCIVMVASVAPLPAQSGFRVLSVDKPAKVFRIKEGKVTDTLSIVEGLSLRMNDLLMLQGQCSFQFCQEMSPSILTYESRVNEVKSFSQILEIANSRAVSVWKIMKSTGGFVFGPREPQTRYMDEAGNHRLAGLISSDQVASVIKSYVLPGILDNSFVPDTSSIVLHTIPEDGGICHFEIWNLSGKNLYINILAIDKSTHICSFCLGLMEKSSGQGRMREFRLAGESAMDLSAFPFLLAEHLEYVAVASEFPYSASEVNAELQKDGKTHDKGREGFLFTF